MRFFAAFLIISCVSIFFCPTPSHAWVNVINRARFCSAYANASEEVCEFCGGTPDHWIMPIFGQPGLDMSEFRGCLFY